MSRDLPTELETAIEAPVVRPFLALHIDLPDTVYAWTGIGTLPFADKDGTSQEWIGAGSVGQVDQIGEATDGSATGVKAALFQVPSEFREDIAQQATKGADFHLYVGALNETYQQVEATKFLWGGKLDTYRVVDSGDSISVEVTGESRMRDQGRPAIKRWTQEYQSRKHPGDKFLEYVPRMAEVSILWAQAESGGGVGGAFSAGRSMTIMERARINRA